MHDVICGMWQAQRVAQQPLLACSIDPKEYRLGKHIEPTTREYPEDNLATHLMWYVEYGPLAR